MKTIAEWQKEIHENAVNHGWYETGARPIPEMLCLVHSEVSEALEAHRENDWDGFKEEMADVVIRMLDMAEYMCIDMEKEISKKHAKNIVRPYRHGGKVC